MRSMQSEVPLGLDPFEWIDRFRGDLTDTELREVIQIAERNEGGLSFEDIPREFLREHTGNLGFDSSKPVFADPFREPEIPSEHVPYDTRDYYTHGTAIVNYAGIPLGEWVKPFANPYGSTWIERMQFQPYESPPDYGDLFVEFLSLLMVCYRYCPIGDWIDAVRAPSKGQWVYWDCKETGRPYTTLRPPQRSGSTLYQYTKPILKFRERNKGSFNVRPKRKRS